MVHELFLAYPLLYFFIFTPNKKTHTQQYVMEGFLEFGAFLPLHICSMKHAGRCRGFLALHLSYWDKWGGGVQRVLVRVCGMSQNSQFQYSGV